jgi:hypothetical protein
LAPADNNAPYLAAFQAASDVTNGLATVAGGMFFERLTAGGASAMRLYTILFIAGWIGRTAAAALIAIVPEPNAKRLRDLL